ncbi:PQQ-binding-like beta-propeller repeat protein, partial [Bacteroidota bacterium]
QGPQGGYVDKVFNSPELSGLVIGPDSVIYCSADRVKGGLYAYSHDGELKWHLPSITSLTPPIVSSDGIIYFSSIKSLFAVNPDGTVKWEYKYGESTFMDIIGINIGIDGKIYFINSNRELNALDENGNLVWQFQDSRIYYSDRNSIVFSPDGKTIYCIGKNIALIAIDLENSLIKWSFGKINKRKYQHPPVVDSQGNIYINAVVDSINGGLATVFSLYPNGEIRWALEEGEIFYAYQPTIDRDGNIYFALDTLYSVDYSGNLNWTISLGYNLGNNLVCDVSDIIYVCLDAIELLAYAVDKKGNIKWELNYPAYVPIKPYAIGFGELYIPAQYAENFYLIK